jgi:uncharacterized protein with HEPN domain
LFGLGYGEDALTLVYLQNKEKRKELFDRINSIEELKDVVSDNCIIFYRPSFGRRYGFGEPDFIIFNKKENIVIFGESKWDGGTNKLPNLNETTKQINNRIKKFINDKNSDNLAKLKEFINYDNIKEFVFLLVLFQVKNPDKNTEIINEKIKKIKNKVNCKLPQIKFKAMILEYEYDDKERKLLNIILN